MKKNKRVVITYGTFDLFHEGHRRFLERARRLGDYLIVGVTSDEYDRRRGKLNVRQSLAERIENIRKSNLADLIIVEEYGGQKVDDIYKYDVDVFAIGSDWEGVFDYLKKHTRVVHLERTKGVSSTELRGIVRLGVVGLGRIARRMIRESKYVSGAEFLAAYHPDPGKAADFAKEHDIPHSFSEYEKFLDAVDAVYVATPHVYHYEYAKQALLAGKHVLVEKPFALTEAESKDIFALAKLHGKVALEALKTAYSPAYRRLIGLLLAGAIGDPLYVRATFTNLLREKKGREVNPDLGGGSFSEYGSYAMLPFFEILSRLLIKKSFKLMGSFNVRGANMTDFTTEVSLVQGGMRLYGLTSFELKSEGDLVIGGTGGYFYVPSPWWKPSKVFLKRNDGQVEEVICEKFHGDGLRYELAYFLELIGEGRTVSHILKPEVTIMMSSVFEQHRRLVHTSLNSTEYDLFHKDVVWDVEL